MSLKPTMAASVSKSLIFVAFIWLLLLSSIIGLHIREDYMDYQCRYDYPSALWKGSCDGPDNDKCGLLCNRREGALTGECYYLKCECQYYCTHFKEKPSGIWKGPCFSSVACSKQCRNKENAFTGHCLKFKCYCSYNT